MPFEVFGQATDEPAVAADEEYPHGEGEAGTTEGPALPENNRTTEEQEAQGGRVEELQEEGVEEGHSRKSESRK